MNSLTTNWVLAPSNRFERKHGQELRRSTARVVRQAATRLRRAAIRCSDSFGDVQIRVNRASKLHNVVIDGVQVDVELTLDGAYQFARTDNPSKAVVVNPMLHDAQFGKVLSLVRM